jgi:hypothetical protein
MEMGRMITEKQELLAAVTAGLHQSVDGFLVAKRAEGLSAGTLRKVYGPRLIHFAAYGERHVTGFP